MTTGPYLVTGATGFLGRHVLAAIQREHPGAHVLALIRKPAEWQQLDWTADFDNVELIEGAVTGDDAWTRDPRLTGLRGIWHLAAMVKHTRRKPEELYTTNIEGTLAMVRLAARHSARMIFVSTSGTVGCFHQQNQAADEDAPYCEAIVRTWPYYHSKIQAERKARALAAELGATLTIIRPPVLLGPGDHRFRSTGHIVRMLTGKLPFLLHGGMHFIDVRDAATAIVRAMQHPAARPVYHLTGTATSVEMFFQMIADISGTPAPKRTLPLPMALALAEAAEKAVEVLPNLKKSPLPDPVVIEMASHWWGLASRHAEAELAYKSRPPYQTLVDTVTWLRANHPDLRRI